MRTKVVEKSRLDMEVPAFPHEATETMRIEDVEETNSPMQLEAASSVEENQPQDGEGKESSIVQLRRRTEK